MRRIQRTILMAAGMCLAAVTVPMGQDAAGLALDKPLRQFTVGDLFPRIEAGIEQTAETWKGASSQVQSTAAERQKALDAGVARVKQKMQTLKVEAKAAKKSKDFTALGTAEGKLKTEEVVYGILDRLETLADRQSAAADSWTRAANAMEAFVRADREFDPYRSHGISKPEAGEAQDSRLDPAGVRAFKNHSEAFDELGASFEDLGSDLRALASDRLKFMSALEKGGHVQTPRLPAK